MTGPVWDGKEKDPWLPERVNAALNAAKAERSIYKAVWEALSSWLKSTAARMRIDTRVPDPSVIFSQAPAWEKFVDQVIGVAIDPVMGWAYEGIFGPGYEWRRRPNVLSYLAGVRNRLVRVPDEVFDLVTAQISAGVILGEGNPELRDRIENVLSTTKTERWKNRAIVIARTETMGALNGSRADAFESLAEEDESNKEYERMWLATVDGRTRLTHGRAPVGADGQRVGLKEPFMVGGFPLMFPGDPSGPPQETIQCRCTTLLLEKGESINLADRQLPRRS